MKILLTGFEAFEGEKLNPALEAVKLVSQEKFQAEIIKLKVPTVFNKSIDLVADKIKELKPDAVLAIGQAGGRPTITVERVGINVDDARIKDNDGNQPEDSKIFEDGKNAYFATIPIKEIVEKIKEEGIPASISNTAGTFVCNHLMYGILYLLEKESSNSMGGFIHVPYIPCQVVDKNNMPSMSLENIVRAIEIAIGVIIEEFED